ncbi:MAG: response regulator, partial [Planctomycetota bacterium]
VSSQIDMVISTDAAMADVSADYVVADTSSPRRVMDLQLCAMGLFDALPQGIALLDQTQTVRWHNASFRSLLKSDETLIGRSLQDVISPADGVDLNRLSVPGGETSAEFLNVRRADKSVLGLQMVHSGISLGPECGQAIIVTVSDVTADVIARQKQDAIYRAGLELENRSSDQITAMSLAERLEVLKDDILQFTKTVLGYETFEIRLLNQETRELLPLLEFGMAPEAIQRRLFAAESENGVTGFVASTKKSYLCSDTNRDQLYLSGAADARSSLTVPLMIHETVFGTFNVESPGTFAFAQTDLDFLTLFGRFVASSLNQLRLLAAEQITLATEHTDELRRSISEPFDDILNAATWMLLRQSGRDLEICDRLRLILDRTRRIFAVVGNHFLTPESASGLPVPTVRRLLRPALYGSRVLIADDDARTRTEAHHWLGQAGCCVEAVRTAGDAYGMLSSHDYDAVLADIRLPDLTDGGYEAFSILNRIKPDVPIIFLATSCVYDPHHSISRSNPEGLFNSLTKPMASARLLDMVERAVIHRRRLKRGDDDR